MFFACVLENLKTVDIFYDFSMKNYVNDSSDDLIRMVDGVLDALTDGEHSKSLKNIKNVNFSYFFAEILQIFAFLLQKNSKIEEQSEDLVGKFIF